MFWSLILNKFTELNTDNLSNILKKNINFNKKEYIKNYSIPLPEVINHSNDIYYYENAILTGNYIGTQKIIGEIIFFDKKSENFNLNGKVVLITNADPGYDFIFNKKIKGLITCYGGANSHMAIRCSEFNITGIIGIGEIKFKELINQKKVYIDPLKNIIKKI